MPRNENHDTSNTQKSRSPPNPEQTPEIEHLIQVRSLTSSISNVEEVKAALETIGEDEIKEEKRDIVQNLPI